MYERRLDPYVLVFSPSLYRHLFTYILFNSHFTSYNESTRSIGKLTVSLQVPEFSFRNITVPLPPCGDLLTTQIQDWEHSLWGCSTTDYCEYRRHIFSVTITHSPITPVNLSSITLVSIFRCSSPPRNTVYVRSVDLSDYLLVFHRTDTHI